MRVGTNGPPVHLFNPPFVLTDWTENGHRLALNVHRDAAADSNVIKRSRRDSAQKCSCDLFT